MWAIASIEERCKLFHRVFPNRRISKRLMLQIMKSAGLKKKKVRIKNVPAKGEERLEEFDSSTLALD